jgi:serine/threonine protein kinase
VSGTDPDPPRRRPESTQPFRPAEAQQPPPPPAENLPLIQGITLQYEIARGGMGVVYSGRQDFLDRRVAVKLLSVELGGESFVQRFQREAKILAGIKHPNIVACHLAGQTDEGQSYLVMEFIDGPSLKKWIADHGPVPVKAALRTTRATAQALAHAHSLGIIHRDVKPENILLETVTSTALDVHFPFTPKVVDLGLARASEGSASLGLTSPGSVMGTPATMSPEQYDEPDAVDFRTDIYGLGCVLFEMLVGQPAFRGKKLSEIVTRKREPMAPDPCLENADVPSAVGALVQTMLAPNRDDRPSSYKELDEQIAALLDVLSASESRPKVRDLGATQATMFHRPQPSKPPGASDKPVAPTAPPTGAPSAGSSANLLRTAELNFLAGDGTPNAAADPVAAFQSRPPAPPPAKDESTRGHLRTAEIDFLAAGGAGGSGTPAFRDGAAPKKRAGLIASLAAGVIGLGAVGYLVSGPGSPPDETPAPGPQPKPQPPKPKPGPSSNRAPVVAAIKGPAREDLGRAFELEADASDADNDALTFEWSWAPEELVSLRGSSTGKKARFQFSEGLPGVECVFHVDVRDGKETTRQSHKVVLGSVPATRPLDGFNTPGSSWQIDRLEGRRWTAVTDPDDPHVSCRASRDLRTMRTALGDEPYWEWSGSVASADEEGRFAKVGLRFEFGDAGWAVVSQCEAAGAGKLRGQIEIVQTTRVGEAWNHAPLGTPVRVEWTQSEDDDYRGAFSVQRRGDALSIQVGKAVQPLEGSLVIESAAPVVFPLPAGTAGQLTLFVDGGIGRFRIERR